MRKPGPSSNIAVLGQSIRQRKPVRQLLANLFLLPGKGFRLLQDLLDQVSWNDDRTILVGQDEVAGLDLDIFRRRSAK